MVKNSNLQQVGDFSFLKFWWAGKLIFWEGGGINFEFWWGVLIVRIGRYIWVTKQPQCPSGVQRLSIYTTSVKREFDGTGGRVDGLTEIKSVL